MQLQTKLLWRQPARSHSSRNSNLPPTHPSCSRRFCTPQWIAAMAEQPEAVALSHGSASLSYQALNAGANHLAAYLCSIGVRMDAPVAICLDRSFDFVIASLAAWKAGGAYLPIDPAWPADRREAVLHDAEA